MDTFNNTTFIIILVLLLTCLTFMIFFYKNKDNIIYVIDKNTNQDHQPLRDKQNNQNDQYDQYDQYGAVNQLSTEYDNYNQLSRRVFETDYGQTPVSLLLKQRPEDRFDDEVDFYDRSKLSDPLVAPTRRPNRYELMPYARHMMSNLPTRGFPDSFTQLGTLSAERSKDDQNKLLRLFGRQVYPGSSAYEYYVMISSGNDIIKMPLEITKEIYNGDNVAVPTLKGKYGVRLYNYDVPRYYPFVPVVR